MIKRGVCIVLFLPVLFLGLPWGLWAREYGRAELQQSSGNTLNRLTEISTQLSVLNERLREELQDSRRNSMELETMLEASRKELGELRRELEALQTTSTGLLSAAENSLTELNGLQAALRKAESSLTSLELSFAAYRQASERRISSLQRQNRLWRWGCAAAGIFAAGFGAAALINR